MYIIGLTGGIACGKSTATNVLQAAGIVVLDCDLIAREVVEPGTPARKAIIRAFSNDVPELEFPDGSLNRKGLGKVVFADEGKRKILQNITGRAIFQVLFRRLLWHWSIGTPIVVIDAPTLFETKSLLPICREIIVIATSPEVQLSRLMKRDASSAEDALNRIRSQIPLADKVNAADVVIWNNGSPNELVERINNEITRLQSRAWNLPILFSGPGCLALCVGLYSIWKLVKV